MLAAIATPVGSTPAVESWIIRGLHPEGLAALMRDLDTANDRGESVKPVLDGWALMQEES